MAKFDEPIGDALESWADIGNSYKSSGILIGNGASRFVWDNFKYESLLDIAKRLDGGNGLRAVDNQLFNGLDTSNFEFVLQSLLTAEKVLNSIGKHDAELMEQYRHIRQSLVHAVHGTHVAHGSVDAAKLDAIASELKNYYYVYSTNYDLLIYWSIMQSHTKEFKDFFWSEGNSFDVSDSDIRGKVTRILFIHGALHIYTDSKGTVCKYVSDARENLLEKFSASSDVPLFVSEGNSEDKLSSIFRSEYLSFAYTTLRQHSGPLVVFGQGLGESDKHIVDAINSAQTQHLVIGIYPSSNEGVIESKTHYRQCFPKKNLAFFDSTTHPLGLPSLRVQVI
ncbi:MAG: DUF4917 family protein [Armatimonadetes bacterium]|nr:DUF4917 family protein [Armatimonadota bacterium]